MPICSYLVIPSAGAAPTLTERLGALPGCEIHRAKDHDVFILLTETSGPGEEAALRRRLGELKEIRTLVLTFGEIQVGASERTPGDAGKVSAHPPVSTPGAADSIGESRARPE